MIYKTIETNAVTGEVTERLWTEEEIAVHKARVEPMEWESLRSQRNKKLQESDIMMFPDRWNFMTPEKQTEWTVYRQALRDLPQTTTDVFGPINWPVKPE